MKIQSLNELIMGFDKLIQVIQFCSEDLKSFLDSASPEQIAEKYQKIEEIKKQLDIEVKKITAIRVEI